MKLSKLIRENLRDPDARFVHCTRRAESILRNRFQGGLDKDYVLHHFDEWVGNIPREDYAKVVELRSSIESRDTLSMSEEEEEAIEAIFEIWEKHYGHGTVIWVSDNEPRLEYGNDCLIFTPPEGTIEIIDDVVTGMGALGSMALWVPMKPIPPEYFEQAD